MDKDIVELAALQSVLPSATLLLCSFHVVQCMPEQMAPQYIPLNLRDDVTGIWRAMDKARDSEEFERQWDLLQRDVADVPPLRNEKHPLTPSTLPLAISKNWQP